jgi:hypothetical protein
MGLTIRSLIFIILELLGVFEVYSKFCGISSYASNFSLFSGYSWSEEFSISFICLGLNINIS